MRGLLLAAALSTGAGAAGHGTWLVPWDPADARSLRCFDEINPFALAFSSAPALTAVQPGLLARARALRRAGVLVLPVAVNDVHHPREPELKSRELLVKLLLDPRDAERHRAELLAAAKGFDGIEIDYERVPPGLWARYADFLDALGRALRARGQRLHVDLEPGPFYDARWARAHGARIAAAADRVKLMAYYERGPAALRPGPGSSLAWIEETARRALAVIPPEKLSVALSLAATEWTAAVPGPVSPWRARRVHYGRALRLRAEQGSQPRWSERWEASYVELPGPRRRELWYETEGSLRRTIGALRALGVRRVDLWYWGALHPDPGALGLCAPARVNTGASPRR